MPNTYKDFVVKVVVEEDKENGGNKIVTPFTRYQETVWCEGKDVTYSYRTDPKLLGKTCVMFCQVIDEHPTLPSEVKKAEEYQNTLGISKVDVLTKAQPIAKLDAEGAVALDKDSKPVYEKLPTSKELEAKTFLEAHYKEPVQEEKPIDEPKEEPPIEEIKP